MVAPAALTFLDSDKYREEYENDMFVGDFKSGRLYHFDLNKNRTTLDIFGHGSGSSVDSNDGPLEDKIANNTKELKDIIFGRGFSGGITDIEVGPDGFLYVVSYVGEIYRIVPEGRR